MKAIAFKAFQKTFNWFLDAYRRVDSARPDDSPAQTMCLFILLILLTVGGIAGVLWMGYQVFDPSFFQWE